MRRSGIAPRRLKRLASLALLGLALVVLAAAGDPAQGLAVVTRQSSTCVLCHAGPWANPHLQGNIGPDLHGVGARLTADQLQWRIAIGDPDGVMPAFGTAGRVRVAAAWAGKPILTEQEIADAVAYLSTLTAP